MLRMPVTAEIAAKIRHLLFIIHKVIYSNILSAYYNIIV